MKYRTAEKYAFDLKQGYQFSNSYTTGGVGASYLQPDYIFGSPSPTIKCAVKQPLSASKNINPAVFPYETQSDAIGVNCKRVLKSYPLPIWRN